MRASDLGVDLLLVDAAALGTAGVERAVAGEPGIRVLRGVVVCRPGEEPAARRGADVVGCDHVVTLPQGAGWLAEAFAPRARVLGLLGVLGGVGVTTTAIACAWGAGEDCLLVDADRHSIGMDVSLGLLEGVGARWAQIPVSEAPLDAASLRASLPHVEGITVATGPYEPGDVESEASAGMRIASVVAAGRVEFPRVVLDLGRGRDRRELVDELDAVVVVLPGTVAGVVATQRALQHLPVDRAVGLVRPSRWLGAGDVAQRLDLPVTLPAPHLRRVAELADCGDLLSGGTGRALRDLGGRIWAAIA